MTEICNACSGLGRTPSLETISLEILRSLRREAGSAPPGALVLYAANDVVDSLENDFGELVDAVEDTTGRTIVLRIGSDYGPENYDVVVE
jgi:Ribonuclease G/E